VKQAREFEGRSWLQGNRGIGQEAPVLGRESGAADNICANRLLVSA